MLSRSLVGIIGSGEIGYDPFDRRSWSGISFYLFEGLRERGVLHRAFGTEVQAPWKQFLMLRHIHFKRDVWKRHYYMSQSYREMLTRQVGRSLRPDDLEHDFLQVGAMFDVPGILEGRARCFSYHDGNLASSLKAPNVPRGLSSRRIDEGLKFEGNVYHGIDRIFSMSEYLRRSFIEDYGVPPQRVSNVGAGINLDRIPEPFPGKRYDTKEVLFIGVDFARKGGPQLLEAFRRVREVHPGATLHIVGPRVLELDPRLSGGVQYHGFLRNTDPGDSEKLRDLFVRSVLFVMPSLYEPFGIALFEAMVHQVPALVSNGWALAENVQPGITGELVEPGSIDDLVDRLRELLGDSEKLRSMGLAARAEVLSRHTWPRVIDRMVKEIETTQNQQWSDSCTRP